MRRIHDDGDDDDDDMQTKTSHLVLTEICNWLQGWQLPSWHPCPVMVAVLYQLHEGSGDH